jgi:tetratricopeptide (TPR) repeat protein
MMKKVHLIIGALLLSACTYNVYAKDFRLADSVRMEQSDAAQYGRVNERRSAWQQKAILKAKATSVDAKEDFSIFVEGKQLSSKERNLNCEYLKELDKSRVREMFVSGRDSVGPTMTVAKARLDLAEAIQADAELDDLYEDAAYEKCLMKYFVSTEVDSAVEAIDDEIELSRTKQKNPEKLERLKRAITAPEEPSDFNEAVDISALALKFRAREQSLAPMHTIMQLKKREGFDYFHPKNHSGQDGPIIALSRACFYTWDSSETLELRDYMKEHPEIGGSTRSSVQYNLGMVFFANKNYKSALKSFEEGANEGALTNYGGKALYMQALVMQQAGKYFDAAVLLDYGKTVYSHDRRLSDSMDETLDFIVRQNLLNMTEVADAASLMVEEKQLAMAGNHVEVEGD